MIKDKCPILTALFVSSLVPSEAYHRAKLCPQMTARLLPRIQVSGAALRIALGLEQTLSPPRKSFDFLVRDLPACDGAGKGGFVDGGSAGLVRHVGEGCEDFGGFGPDGDILHGVVIRDPGFREAVGWRWRREGIDRGDDAVAVAEAGRDAGSGVGGGVAAGVDVALDGNGEELRGDQRVHLLRHRRVSGLVGEAWRVGEEAFGMIGEMGVEPDDEVFRSCLRLGVACSEREQKECAGEHCDESGLTGSSGEHGRTSIAPILNELDAYSVTAFGADLLANCDLAGLRRLSKSPRSLGSSRRFGR